VSDSFLIGEGDKAMTFLVVLSTVKHHFPCGFLNIHHIGVCLPARILKLNY